MKTIYSFALATTHCFLMLSVNAMAADKPEFSLGGDVVSSYVWRGSQVAGFEGINVQPYASMDYAGFTLGAWASTNFEGDGKEVDFSLGYTLGGLSATLTDYWFGGNYFRYGKETGTHTYEATLSYDFGEKLPLSVSWSTLLYGDDYKEDGSKRYSSYLELNYSTSLSDVDLTFTVGASPWSSNWYHLDAEGDLKSGFQVNNIALTAAKEIKLTESFSLPLFGQVVFNPCQEDVHFVIGLSL
jgi:hypothetical protein